MDYRVSFRDGNKMLFSATDLSDLVYYLQHDFLKERRYTFNDIVRIEEVEA